jgi:hypothetical protein
VTSPGKFGVGFLIGVVLTGVLSLTWSSSTPETLPPSVSTSATPEVEIAPWLEPGETRIGSAIILPRGLEVDGGVVAFEFELAGLSPSLIEREEVDYQGDVVAMPEHWVLTTTAGTTVSASTGPGDESIRFELPDPDDQVATIDLVGWREARPRGDRVELPIEVGETGVFASGTMTIETVLEQRFSTIVQFDFDETDDDWQFPAVLPLDSAWRVSGRQFGGMQLIWDGADAPDRVILEDGGFVMRPVDGNLRVVDQRDGS